jgi:hypothetical protein
MDSGDIFFYVVIAVSVVSSIVKAARKKKDVEKQSVPTEKGGDVFRRILEEMQQADDYIPKIPIPEPVAQKAKPQVQKPVQVQPDTTRTSARKNVEEPYLVSEVRASPSSSASRPVPTEEVATEETAPFDFDLSDPEEFKKAVVYSEILKPKF